MSGGAAATDVPDGVGLASRELQGQRRRMYEGPSWLARAGQARARAMPTAAGCYAQALVVARADGALT